MRCSNFFYLHKPFLLWCDALECITCYLFGCCISKVIWEYKQQWFGTALRILTFEEHSQQDRTLYLINFDLKMTLSEWFWHLSAFHLYFRLFFPKVCFIFILKVIRIGIPSWNLKTNKWFFCNIVEEMNFSGYSGTHQMVVKIKVEGGTCRGWWRVTGRVCSVSSAGVCTGLDSRMGQGEEVDSVSCVLL